MQRFLTVILALASAKSAFAGITYEFTTTSSGMPHHGMSGVVRSDAGKRRIEITASDDTIFPAGSVLLSSGNALTVFDPAKKTYYDLDLDQYLQQTAGLGSRIEFSNPKASVHENGAGETIDGYPTHRATVDTSFGVTPNVPGLGASLSVAIHSTTEVWLTDKLPADAANVLQTSRMHTGVPAIDKILESTATLRGFPLKQVTTTNVSISGGDPVTSTSTTVVSNIRTDAKVAASDFAVPAGFKKVDDPLKAMMKNFGLD